MSDQIIVNSTRTLITKSGHSLEGRRLQTPTRGLAEGETRGREKGQSRIRGEGGRMANGEAGD